MEFRLGIRLNISIGFLNLSDKFEEMYLSLMIAFKSIYYFLLYKICIIKKYCFSKKFRLLVFDGFTRFRMS